jgi:hypothetical protein
MKGKFRILYRIATATDCTFISMSQSIFSQHEKGQAVELGLEYTEVG